MTLNKKPSPPYSVMEISFHNDVDIILRIALYRTQTNEYNDLETSLINKYKDMCYLSNTKKTTVIISKHFLIAIYKHQDDRTLQQNGIIIS